MEKEISRDRSGATTQPSRATPTAAIRLKRAVLGSRKHQARLAEIMRIVGTSDGQEIHDIAAIVVAALRSVERGSQRPAKEGMLSSSGEVVVVVTASSRATGKQREESEACKLERSCKDMEGGEEPEGRECG